MKKFAAVCLASVLTVPQIGWAQTAVSQPGTGNRQIPASEKPGARELRDAMRRIARNRRNVEALIDAGNAALLLNDADAALNFFSQANRFRAGDGRIKAGLGAAYVRSENPFEGLRYFDEATKLGVSERTVAADRGLAFDLLGNFERAQQDYKLASTVAKSSRLTIQHAISLSLSGKGKEADALLNPLLAQNHPAAWRARAFMLAARGEYKKSQEVTRGFLDIRSAQRIERYLKQMPALTGPQQAAAIHLGHFPARNIGRDSDIVRSVAANLPAADPSAVSPSGGDSRLTPSGTPFGAKPPKVGLPSIAQLRISSAVKSSTEVFALPQRQVAAVLEAPPKPIVTASNAAAPVEVPIKTAASETKTAVKRPIATETKVATSTTGVQAGFDAVPTEGKEAKVAEVADAPPATQATVIQAPDTNVADIVPETSAPVEVAVKTQEPSPTPVQTAPPITPPAQTEPTGPIPTEPTTSFPIKTAQAASTPVQTSEATADNFDLGDIVDSIEIPESEKVRKVEPVDLSKLPTENKPQQRTQAPAAAAPAKPAKIVDESVSTTSRHWVQIATGDMSAMRGEYRRLSRKYPELFEGQQGWSSPWKTMSRLVVGPFSGYTAAKEWYDALKEAGGDGFVWRSAQGTKVTKLNSK